MSTATPLTHSQQINNTPQSYICQSFMICHYGSQVTSCCILLICAVSVSGDIPQPGTATFLYYTSNQIMSVIYVV